jgi:outer membrane immunogenic protein
MKKHLFLLAFAVSALLPAATALAADLDPPPPPMEQLRPATYDWSGAYVGGWVGNACIDGTANDQTDIFSLAGCGGKAGLMAGYNHQIDNIVLGVEGDYGWGGEIARNDGPGADIAYSLNSIGTIRGRAGWAMDDTMLFVTGGWAFANGTLSGLAGSPAAPFSIDQSHNGWTIGGGIEHAVTDNIRIRLDYLYTKMNVVRYTAGCCNIDVDWGGEHEVRAGMAWAF